MTIPKEGLIPSGWDAGEIEFVPQCPSCGAEDSSVAHDDVRDWSFFCDQGSWTYRQCGVCRSLYLNPRPKESAIGRVYGAYYTHDAGERPTNFKLKLANECLSHFYGIHAQPQLGLGPLLKALLLPLRPLVYVPFPLAHMRGQTAGNLIDIGCGNGDVIYKALQMGWQVTGLEIDEVAVRTARGRGLNVMQGSFEVLAQVQQTFDCVVCSHVIEHVYDPKLLIKLLLGVAKPGATVYLALPNPQSILRGVFGRYWRGLEAPRHISLPSIAALVKIFEDEGVAELTVFPTALHTFGESMRLRLGKTNGAVRIVNKVLHSLTTLFPLSRRQDMIEIRVRK